MPKIYFGFALADSMFAGLANGTGIRRFVRTPEFVRELVAQGVVPCLNPSHTATIAAMRERFGIEVQIPAIPPRVELKPGDSVVVMGVRGLPRLTDRHEYTAEEINSAEFAFSLYQVE